MAKRATTKTTDQYTHPSAKRANLPTEQTGKTVCQFPSDGLVDGDG